MDFYTDGATSNNGSENASGGWAFIGIKDNLIILKEIGHIENATNNICEMTAILSACAAAPKDELNNIYSDSAYCINCANEKWYLRWYKNGWLTAKKQPVLNRELWEKLIPYFENPNFNFIKVKGHAINEFNNLVDKMAVEAKQC